MYLLNLGIQSVFCFHSAHINSFLIYKRLFTAFFQHCPDTIYIHMKSKKNKGLFEVQKFHSFHGQIEHCIAYLVLYLPRYLDNLIWTGRGCSAACWPATYRKYSACVCNLLHRRPDGAVGTASNKYKL